jgi:glycosyltransferase involved in cell wall biosynthesis
MSSTSPSDGDELPARRTDSRAVIALITEGTYPTSPGGVGTWCHELVSGLPEYDFDIYSVMASGTERPAWTLPDNVSRLVKIPLWPNHAGPRRRLRTAPDSFRATYGRFLFSLFADDPDEFLSALQALREFARTNDLGAALTSESVLHQLDDFWKPASQPLGGSRPTPAPTVADVFEAATMIEHFLRPLSIPIAPAAVYHSSSNGLASLVALAGKWDHGAPFLLTEHGVYLRERYLSLNKNSFSHPVRTVLLRFFRLLSAVAYREADLMTPVSQFNSRWAQRNGADMSRVRPIHNAVDPAAFPESDVRPDVPTLSFVGRVDPLKDLETLIKAAAIVRTSVPNLKVRLYGNIPKGNEKYAQKLAELVRKRRLIDTVSFEGPIPRDRIVDAYRSGHVVVLSSISEGFPYTVVEAMMAGHTTVSTDVGGVAEAVGDTGLVVPPRNPAAFAEACVKLLLDAPLRERLARKARQRALDHFTLERFLTAYGEVYADLRQLPVAHRTTAAELAPAHPTAELGRLGPALAT